MVLLIVAQHGGTKNKTANIYINNESMFYTDKLAIQAAIEVLENMQNIELFPASDNNSTGFFLMPTKYRQSAHFFIPYPNPSSNSTIETNGHGVGFGRKSELDGVPEIVHTQQVQFFVKESCNLDSVFPN